MTKKKKRSCPTCEDSGFVVVARTLVVTSQDLKTECVPCWSCDLGLKIEKLETRDQKFSALSRSA